MNHALRNSMTALSLLVCSAAAPAIADFKPDEWRAFAPIQIDAIPGKGLVEFPLPPEILDASRSDQADLRVADAADRETAYVLRMRMPETRTVAIPVTLYNRTYLPKQEASVTVDFGKSILKNSITVATPGRNFRRRLVIEASEDGQGWKKLREDAFLFRVPGANNEGPAYDRSTVAVPDTSHRYMRLTLLNAPDDPDRIEIENVSAARMVTEPGETTAVPARVAVTNEKNTTWIELDLSFKNLAVSQVTLDLGAANFFRVTTIQGRNAATRVVSVTGEDGAAARRTVEEPWQTISSDAIYRYSAGGSVDESLALGLRRTGFRYLRIGIVNGDDPPLADFRGVEVRRCVRSLAFQAKAEGSYSLYAGNAAARAPSYDIVHFAERLRGEGVAAAKLGAMIANPRYGKAGAMQPWSERHKILMWLALLTAAAVLCLIIARQIRSMPTPPAE